MRASLAASTSATVVVPFSPRFRFLVLLVRMCCLNAAPLRNLLFFVRLNRLAAPRWVLIFSFFGISLSYVAVVTALAAVGFALPPPVCGRRLRMVCI